MILCLVIVDGMAARGPGIAVVDVHGDQRWRDVDVNDNWGGV